VAHEINNPLAYVLLNLEYLMREVPRWDGSAARLEHFRERLEEAQHGANRVAAILRELSSLSARSSERRTLVDVEQVLRRAAKQVEAQIAEHGALVLELHEVPRVVGDFGRLEQLFTNLLVNAAQALVPGVSGEVSVRLCAPAPNWIEIEVADTGAGIPASDLGRVFDPFFTTKPVGVGTGLGLPICHAIVRSLGGHITVESDVGRGSRFRVMLPAAPASYRPTEPPISAVASSRRGRTRVLIVDDEAPIAQMLGRVLEDANDVEVCTDPSQALELLTSGRPYDVVLCDLLMPKISGMDLYEELARRAPGQERKVVFMTGGAFTRRAAEFLRRVPNERLEKPFDIEQVRELLARLGPRH
jgi:CheY-like chemotaxis protein